MAEEEVEQPLTKEQQKAKRRDLKWLNNLMVLAIKQIKIVQHYEEQNYPMLVKLNDMFHNYPDIQQKHKELAVKRNGLIREYNETGDKRLLRKEKRLSKAIPTFDESDKENDKKLKAMYKRFLKLHRKIQRNNKLADNRMQLFNRIMLSDPRLTEMLKRDSYDEVFEMD